MGEALAASLTIPVVLPLAGGDWRLALVAWSVPIFLVALAGMLHQRGRPAEPMHEKARVWWRLEVAGHVAPRLISGGCSSIYFTTNAFLPDVLHRVGRPELLNPALSANNWLQIPASLLLLFFPGGS